MSEGPLAVVTGSSGAIGSAITASLVRDGWRVLGVDCLLASEPVGNGSEALVADVALEETWEQVADRVMALGGILHGLVHCAARQICAPLLETRVEDWQRLLATNLSAAFLGCRALHASLARGPGAVVAVGSVHARQTSLHMSAYAATKGGLSALMRALAIEWAPDGIRVNTVLPGAVDSAMLRDGLRRSHLVIGDESARLQALAARTVAGRIGQPADIAETVAFLLDVERAGFVTGAEWIIDGGASVRLSSE